MSDQSKQDKPKRPGRPPQKRTGQRRPQKPPRQPRKPGTRQPRQPQSPRKQQPSRKPDQPQKSRPARQERRPSTGRQPQRRPHSLKSAAKKKRAYHLLVNRMAGKEPDQSVKMAKKLERRLKRSGWDVEIQTAANWKEFTHALTMALRARPFAIVVFGGDGSVRAAAARIARAKGLLGIVPCGRYNNIFHSLYGHTDQEEALNIVRSGYQMRIDAALANGQFFVGSLITGLVPTMLENLGAKKLPRLAMTWGKLAARSADDTMPQTTSMKVDFYSFEAQPMLLHIHLLSHLMRLRFAPVAVPDDGYLVIIYDTEGTRDAVVHYIRDLKKDKYQYSDGLQMLRGRKLSVTRAAGRTWLIDGDIIDFSGDEITVEVLHRVLRVFSNVRKD
jgi:diacylglycerol kinase family enzyme